MPRSPSVKKPVAPPAPPSLLSLVLSGAAPVVVREDGANVRLHALPEDADEAPLAKKSSSLFTKAEQGHIRRMLAYMSPIQLVVFLNDQRERGSKRPPCTVDQMLAQIQALEGGEVEAPAGRWGVRSTLSSARKAGIVEPLSLEVLRDFAEVFKLQPGQLEQLVGVVRGTATLAQRGAPRTEDPSS